ncbi:DUF3298 domain-containing protein [bacterium]|nr:DUF3298 domain-containing protein [bacterium]
MDARGIFPYLQGKMDCEDSMKHYPQIILHTGSFLMIGLLLIAGCGGGQKEAVTKGPLYYRYLEYHDEQGQCGEYGLQPCVRVDMVYPYVSKGPKAGVNAVNGFTQDFLQHAFYDVLNLRGDLEESETQVETSEEFTRAFVAAYEQFRESYPESSIGYSFQFEGAVKYNSERYATLLTIYSAYTGGAHPYGERKMASFDLATGKQLDLEDIVHAPEKLPALGEKFFRRAHGYSHDTDWAETPYFYETGGFVLSEKFGLTEEGLVFWYDPYEIAPYSEGPSRFAIPWDALQRILTSAMHEEFLAPSSAEH